MNKINWCYYTLQNTELKITKSNLKSHTVVSRNDKLLVIRVLNYVQTMLNPNHNYGKLRYLVITTAINFELFNIVLEHSKK